MDFNLLSYKDRLRISNENDLVRVFDPVRKKHVEFKGEEMVRQLLICYLEDEHGVGRSRIAVEKMLYINKLEKRFDILVFDHNANPWMVIECKAPGVKLSQAVIDQASLYNSELKAPYLLISNGILSRIFRLEFKHSSWQELDSFPQD